MSLQVHRKLNFLLTSVYCCTLSSLWPGVFKLTVFLEMLHAHRNVASWVTYQLALKTREPSPGWEVFFTLFLPSHSTPLIGNHQSWWHQVNRRFQQQLLDNHQPLAAFLMFDTLQHQYTESHLFSGLPDTSGARGHQFTFRFPTTSVITQCLDLFPLKLRQFFAVAVISRPVFYSCAISTIIKERS